MEAHLWATQPLRGQFSFQANMAALLLWALQNLLLARARAQARRALGQSAAMRHPLRQAPAGQVRDQTSPLVLTTCANNMLKLQKER